MSAQGTLLVVDDEAYVRESLAEVLERRGYAVRTAASAADALAPELLAGVDAVISDLKMPGEDGTSLLRRLLERDPELPVILLTANGTVASAVECVKAGASDYLLKPTDPAELSLAVDRALAGRRKQRELDYLRSRAGASRSTRDPLGASQEWRRILSLVEAAAPTDAPVLLTGESGTGKGELARLLHRRSRRADGPFVQVNCAAVPIELFESEFFGHRRGAFTGANADREGRFRIAHGGTLLLDEIDTLPAMAQAKVLRVIEEGEFERLGESRPTRVDVRLVTATNADLVAAVARGSFRADLYYRIHVVAIQVPPLRDRKTDVAVLADAFLDEACHRLGKEIRGLAPETLAALESYPWPGNVRELKNVIERSVLLESSDLLMPESLPFDTPEPGAGTSSLASGDLHLRRRLRAAEEEILREALRRSGGVKREAARLLGIDERNLAYFLRKYDLLGTEK